MHRGSTSTHLVNKIFLAAPWFQKGIKMQNNPSQRLQQRFSKQDLPKAQRNMVSTWYKHTAGMCLKLSWSWAVQGPLQLTHSCSVPQGDHELTHHETGTFCSPHVSAFTSIYPPKQCWDEPSTLCLGTAVNSHLWEKTKKLLCSLLMSRSKVGIKICILEHIDYFVSGLFFLTLM